MVVPRTTQPPNHLAPRIEQVAVADGETDRFIDHHRLGEPFAAVCEVLETPAEAAALLLRWVEDGIIARPGCRPSS